MANDSHYSNEKQFDFNKYVYIVTYSEYFWKLALKFRLMFIDLDFVNPIKKCEFTI